MLAVPELHARFADQLQQGSSETFLHHYTKLSTALEHILGRQELRLGRFADTNDPREYRRPRISMVGPRLDPEVSETVVRLARELLKETWSLVCLTMDAPSAGAPVTAWDRGWARSRMWAQYADDHRGVCLVFDRQELMRELRDQLLVEGAIMRGPVRYENTSALNAFVIDTRRVDPAHPRFAVIDQMMTHQKQLFLLKSKDWETEHEYRFLLRRDDRAPYFATVRASLRGVVLGDAVSEAYRPSVDALCHTLQIGAARIGWDNGTPYLRSLDRR